MDLIALTSAALVACALFEIFSMVALSLRYVQIRKQLAELS
jgi:hypothetical protein